MKAGCRFWQVVLLGGIAAAWNGAMAAEEKRQEAPSPSLRIVGGARAQYFVKPIVKPGVELDTYAWMSKRWALRHKCSFDKGEIG